MRNYSRGLIAMSIIISHVIGEDSCYVNVYSLPEESWQSELDKLQPDNSGKVCW